ncbi:hypothetical protein [Hyphococcus sp.]|uniref:hypothetical protein n=1 Tax=Hyphococcus sp. TaxID=2038636 RepID=UPI0035C71911
MSVSFSGKTWRAFAAHATDKGRPASVTGHSGVIVWKLHCPEMTGHQDKAFDSC